MIILLDQDGVLADFEGALSTAWKKHCPPEAFVSPEERKSFHYYEDYPEKYWPQIRSLYLRPGFYRNLPTIAGAQEAIAEMQRHGHTVKICTSPLSQYENCILEKYQWVEENLGQKMIEHIIVTRDKTLVAGDILIDDNPEVKGLMHPRWCHILYDQPYNRHLASQPRLTWNNWQEVLNSLDIKP
jgi:5'-nucleotidase